MIFSIDSGLNESIYGHSQGPIKMFLEKRGEAFEQSSPLKDLFLMTPSTHHDETYTSMTAMEGFQPVPENGAYPTDSMQEGFKKTLTNQTWKDSFTITQEMVEDAKLLDLRKRPEQFVAGYYRTRELFGAALFGAAMQGDDAPRNVSFRGQSFPITCADGVTLFSENHPYAVNSGTQSNVFMDDFSNDALAAMECAMQNFRGDNGEILDVAPDTILIPNDYALKKAVFAAIGADRDPATANNGFNYNYGRWNVIVWPYLNKYMGNIKPWVLLDSSYNKRNGGAIWQDRIELSVKSRIDPNTDGNVWSGRARFAAGFNDWRFAACGGSGADHSLLPSGT